MGRATPRCAPVGPQKPRRSGWRPRRKHYAPERGPPGPCALGLQTLRGHRLQPAFGHHQGRCFPFFAAGGGLACDGSPWIAEWLASEARVRWWRGVALPFGPTVRGAAATWQTEAGGMQSNLQDLESRLQWSLAASSPSPATFQER